MIAIVFLSLCLQQPQHQPTFLLEGTRYELTSERVGSEQRERLHAIDAATGQPLWSITVYTTVLDLSRELGGQADPIARVWLEAGVVHVESQRGQRYQLDPVTHNPRSPPPPPSQKSDLTGPERLGGARGST